MREIKFSYMYQHKETCDWIDLRYTLDEIENGDVNYYGAPSGFKLIAKRQCIEIKDKNGVDIYEGDVVMATVTIQVSDDAEFSHYNSHEDGTRTKHCGKPKPCFIEYTNEGYVAKHSTGNSIPFWIGGVDKYEVIGNIYENPELIRGDTK